MASAIASPIERVRQAVPIGEIVAERVALVKAGRALKGLCPFHAEQTPSFYVYPESGRFHCFGCLPSGHLVKTADGVRPIEDVRVGDLVVAGDGRLRPVVRTYHHPYAGDLVRIRCNPFKAPLLLTPDHKVPVVRPRSGRIEEVPAGDLRPDNHLQYVPPRRDLEEPPRDALPTWERTYGSCFPGYDRLTEDLQCGRSQLSKWIQELRAAVYIDVKRRGQGKTSIYTLRKLQESQNGTSRSPETRQPAVPIQDGEEDPGEEDSTVRTSKLRRRPTPNRSALVTPPTSANDHTERLIPSKRPPSSDRVSENRPASADEVVNDCAAAAAIPARRPLRARLAPEERRRYDEDRRRIVDYLSDFARELGDAAPLASSVTRAVNIQRAAGVAFEDFAEALYHARAVTKEHWAAIRKETTRPGATWSTKRAMPYFFAELERVLGLRELPETPEEHAARTAAEAEERDRVQRHAGRGDARASPPRAWVQTYEPRRRRSRSAGA